jgi:hypothetical protein
MGLLPETLIGGVAVVFTPDLPATATPRQDRLSGQRQRVLHVCNKTRDCPSEEMSAAGSIASPLRARCRRNDDFSLQGMPIRGKAGLLISAFNAQIQPFFLPNVKQLHRRGML